MLRGRNISGQAFTFPRHPRSDDVEKSMVARTDSVEVEILIVFAFG